MSIGVGLGLSLGRVRFRRRAAALTLPAGATVIYSAVRITSYNGPFMRVVRASDNATFDIPYDNSGRVDVAAALAFQGASKLYTSILYDNTGNGNHATQTTAANRPSFVATNVFDGSLGMTCDSGPGGSGPSKHLNLPAGVTLNRQNGTVFAVAAPNSTWNSNALYEIGTAAGSRAVVYTNPNSTLNFLSGADGALQIPKTIQARPSIIGHRFSSTAMHVYYKAASSAFAARGVGVYSGGRLGGSSAGLGFNYRGEHYFFAVWPRALTDQEVADVRAALALAFPAAAPKTFGHCLVFDGDSIVEGYGATDLQNNMRQTLRAFGSTADIDVYNQAVFGTTSDVIYNARVAKHSGIDRVAAPGKNILNFGIGSNDLNAGASAATIWSTYILPYVRYCKSLNYTPVVGTVLARNTITGSKETERLALNGTYRSNAGPEGYLVADYDTVADLANPANTAYYLDGIHPTSLGYTRMASVLTPVVQQVLAS